MKFRRTVVWNKNYNVIKEVALTAIKAATNQQALQDVRVKYLGKKGEVTALLKGLGKLSPEERPKMGALVNAVREALEAETR